MSLKIKINKQAIPAESKSTKRRIQRIESDDEDAFVGSPSYNPEPPEPRHKKPRTQAGFLADSDDDDFSAGGREDDEDIDIDGDIDTTFLPDPRPTTSRSISPVQSSSKIRIPAANPKARQKEKEPSRSAKSSKSAGKKPKRQVVYTDSEEDFNDPDVIVTGDDDFEPELEYGSGKKGTKARGVKLLVGKPSAKGKTVKKEDVREITFRDERKLPPAPATDALKRYKAEEEVVKPVFADPLDQPIPKKRKLPPIKKNKPAGTGSNAASTPTSSKPVPPVEKKETLTPAPTSNQVGVRKPAGASSDLNLLDSSVYADLFKSTGPGIAAPSSGLNRKQKEEERRKELNKMRNEARAKREAESRHSFDLQAAPEKIQRYEEQLRTYHSMARYPNILGAAFKEMFDRRRASRVATAGA